MPFHSYRYSSQSTHFLYFIIRFCFHIMIPPHRISLLFALMMLFGRQWLLKWKNKWEELNKGQLWWMTQANNRKTKMYSHLACTQQSKKYKGGDQIFDKCRKPQTITVEQEECKQKDWNECEVGEKQSFVIVFRILNGLQFFFIIFQSLSLPGVFLGVSFQEHSWRLVWNIALGTLWRLKQPTVRDG